MSEQNNTNSVTMEAVDNNESVNMVAEDVAPTKELKKLNAKQWTIIGSVVAVVITLAVGIGIYNTPANRLTRQLDLGQKYLEEQNYEQAVLAFNEAIAIDDKCLEAYVGGIEAYLQLGNSEELLAFYDRALVATESLEGDVLADNMDYICSIYLYADDVKDDTAKVIEILEKGLVVTDDNAEVKKELVDNYLVQAKDYIEKDAFAEGLKAYDRLLELDAQNEQVITYLSACLNEYFEVLIAAKNYDEIRRLAEKYGSYGLNVDFDAILVRVAELERIDAENHSFMENIYSLMSAEDYQVMVEVDGSDEAEAFVLRMESDEYVYIPEDASSINGVGAGVYKFGDANDAGLAGYYFYFGNYENGVRSGQGKSFIKNGDTGYLLFSGEWKDNAPNGYGEESSTSNHFNNNNDSYSKTIKGNLINGLWDGHILSTINAYGHAFDLSYDAVKGIPTEDKTTEFLAYYLIDPSYYIDKYVYAYDVKSDGAWTASSAEFNSAIGTIGYGGPVE